MTGRGESDAIAALEKRIEELEAALAAQKQAAQPSLTESEAISAAREAEPGSAEEQTAEEEELFAEPAEREAEPGSAEEQAEGDVAAADAAAAGPQSAEPIEGPISEEQTSEEQQPEESGDLSEEECAADAADERAEEELAEIPGEDSSFDRDSAECEAENEAENAEVSAEPSIDAEDAEADLAEHGEAAADPDEIQTGRNTERRSGRGHRTRKRGCRPV